ncbi:enkurin isoform X2 [Pelodiscus sinensis]|uniref:enkurin isoform X2 n=2 Tax=Pelodiscus sinensis TaxID=13735 RepID=UPI003F6CE4D4
MTALCAQESIYNLLPRVEEKPVKLPRYISTFRPSVKHEIEESRAPWKTMGPAKIEVPSPKNFLQKRSKEPKLLQRKQDEGRKRMLTIPPVPHVTDHPLMGIQSKKNFMNTNAANVIMGVAKKPQPICVDRRQGDKYLLETSGLVPKYINKKGTFPLTFQDYGLTPTYVIKRNEEVKKAQEEYDAYVKETLRQKAMKRLSDEERESLLQGLKKNWEEVHHEFQGLSVEIDTLPKKIHKQRLETQMKQLEHDINTIEKHKIIYIANK